MKQQPLSVLSAAEKSVSSNGRGPKRRRPAWKRFLAPGIAALLVVGGAAAFVKYRAAKPISQTQYKVAAVTRGPVKKTVSATGTLQPWKVVDIKSKAGGRVNALLVETGTTVKPGQIIARIDPSDTQLSVNQAQADIDSALARTEQSDQTYQLQKQQTTISIANARAALQAAQARMATARAQASSQPALTNAAIAQAQASFNQAVKQRKALDSTNPQQIAAAKAAYDQAVANAKNAQSSLTRQASLVQKGYVAQQAVDTAQAGADVAQAQVASARAKLDTVNGELEANVEAADARIAQARAALQNAQAGRVDIANRQNAVGEAVAAVAQSQAALNQAQANAANNAIRRGDITAAKATVARASASLSNAKTTLAQTTVRAPYEGIVLQKYVEAGTIITSGQSLSSTGTSIVQIGDITQMYVDVAVDETDIGSVDPGQKVDVSMDAYSGIPFSGTVKRIEPLAVVASNVTSFHVRVEVDNSSPTFRLLRPGMNATCEFIVDSKDDAVSVPNEAIQTDDSGSKFAQIASGGAPAPPDSSGAPAESGALVGVKITKRPVETGVEGNDTTEIVKGLKEGEKIVTETIEPAAPTAAPAASSPFGGGGGRGPGGFGGGRGGGR